MWCRNQVCFYFYKWTAFFNPRMWNAISSRIFWKRHHEMDSSWGTIKNRFRTKITFLSQIFQERTLARVPISLTDRYWEFWQISFFFTKTWGDFVFVFLSHFKNLKGDKTFFWCKITVQNYKKFPKESFHLTAQICDDGLCTNI